MSFIFSDIAKSAIASSTNVSVDSMTTIRTFLENNYVTYDYTTDELLNELVVEGKRVGEFAKVVSNNSFMVKAKKKFVFDRIFNVSGMTVCEEDQRELICSLVAAINN